MSAVGLMDNIADVPNTLAPYLELNVVYQRLTKIRQLPEYSIGTIYPTPADTRITSRQPIFPAHELPAFVKPLDAMLELK